MELFIIIAASIFLGSIFLWLSGYSIGKNSTSKISPPQKTDISDKTAEVLKKSIESLTIEKTALEKENLLLKETISSNKTEESENRPENENSEIAELTSQLARVEGEKSKALFELDTLKDEIEELNKKLEESSNRPKPPPPTFKDSDVHKSHSDIHDELQAKLDLEMVAHQKTRDELAQIKKLAAVKMGTSPTFAGSASGGRTASKFQTMAFNTRAAGGISGGEVLKNALEKVQAEKDKLQSELQKAQKEIQNLNIKMMK
jgi:chromosome segregation ATPase